MPSYVANCWISLLYCLHFQFQRKLTYSGRQTCQREDRSGENLHMALVELWECLTWALGVPSYVAYCWISPLYCLQFQFQRKWTYSGRQTCQREDRSGENLHMAFKLTWVELSFGVIDYVWTRPVLVPHSNHMWPLVVQAHTDRHQKMLVILRFWKI